MPPLVSILIPAYNAQSWVDETLKSALAQTWPTKEVIVVDDGSADDTLSILRRYESPTVKVVTQQNQGAAAARNTALSHSQGTYIQWLDADDLLAHDKVGLQVRALLDQDDKRTVASGPWGKFFYRTSKARFEPSPLWCDLTPVEWLTRKLGEHCHMQTATWLVSREVTELAGPWNTTLLGDDDGEYFCRVKLNSSSIKFVAEAKTYYRSTDSGRLSFIGFSDKKIAAQFHSMRLHIGYLRSMEDSERTRAACVRYLQQFLFFFHPQRPDIVQEASSLAVSLGGRLHPPQVGHKYRLIHRLLGWSAAKHAQLYLPRLKARALQAFDHMAYQYER